MNDTSENYNFFKEGEYPTIVLHPWWEEDPESPKRKKHLIHWRVQSLFEQYTSLLAEERGKRPFKFKEEEKKRQSECSIDIYRNSREDRDRKEWAKPYFYEKGSRDAMRWRAITNLYPFLAPLWWIFLPNHCENLNMISREDMRVAIEYAFNLMGVLQGDRQKVEIDQAKVLDETMQGLKEKVNGVHWGMNFGPKAGASIDHAHIQIGGIPTGAIGQADKEIDICDNSGEDIMGRLIKAIKRDKNELIIRDLNGVVIYTPFAPKVSHQVNIISEDFLPNLISSSEKQREKISEAIFLALKGIANMKIEGEKGKLVSARINNVNVLVKQTRFDNLQSRYRLNFEILPRETTFGFSELSGFYVYDKFPKYTADRLKKEIERIN